MNKLLNKEYFEIVKTDFKLTKNNQVYVVVTYKDVKTEKTFDLRYFSIKTNK